MKKKGKSEEKENKPEIIKTNLEILPIRYYDNSSESFVLSDESYMDIFGIIPRDVEKMAADELRNEVGNFISLLRTSGVDLKFVSMNFPLNTARQREILEYHKSTVKDAVRIKWIDRQIAELKRVDSNVHTSNFYLFIFGSNREEFIKNKQDISKQLCSGIDALAEKIPRHQKIQILLKLCNMNNTYDLHELEEWETVNESEEK